MANLESNFVMFKQDMLISLVDLKEEIKAKDDKIELLEKNIINLEVINKLLQKDNTDLNNISKKQKQIDKKINAVQTQVNNLEKSHLLQNPLNVLYLN